MIIKKFIWIPVVLAILAALFASTFPDGLDFVAEKLGFAEKGIERTAPMANYGLNFLPQGILSTSLAGIIGILIIMGISWLVVKILKTTRGK